MRFAILLILIAGCGPSGPQLRSIGIGIDQDKVPLVFALKLANGGDAVTIDRLALKVDRVMPLCDDDYRPPEAFDVALTLLSETGGTYRENLGQPMTIPGGESNVHGAIRWSVPNDAPPMLAIVSGRLVLRNGSTTVYTSQPYVFMLQSQSGSIAAVEAAVGTHQLPKLLEVLRGVPGKRTTRFDEFLKRLESQSARTI